MWLPLTPTFGSNTLWTESAPGRGDFRPVELSPGQAMLFWGHQCEHYTVPNTTDSTRVSLDFRVIPEERLYCDEYLNSHRRDGLPRFGLGGFYGALPLVPTL